MSKIYVAHGLTSSGKTEVANYLEEKYNIYHYHPIAFVKRQYEQLIQKPAGFLDSLEGKLHPVPGNEQHTMQEFMVATYHFYREWMPARTSLNMLRELPEVLNKKDVCAVSLRSLQEISTLLEIAEAEEHKIIFLDICRLSEIRESSDEFYEEIRNRLIRNSDFIFHIDNNFSIKDLHRKLDNIIHYCR